MRFSEVDNFIIFGGGEILFEACLLLKKRKKRVFVISSKEQINEKIYYTKDSLKNPTRSRIGKRLPNGNIYSFRDANEE